MELETANQIPNAEPSIIEGISNPPGAPAPPANTIRQNLTQNTSSTKYQSASPLNTICLNPALSRNTLGKVAKASPANIPTKPTRQAKETGRNRR
jgi:hypothetical protein